MNSKSSTNNPKQPAGESVVAGRAPSRFEQATKATELRYQFWEIIARWVSVLAIFVGGIIAIFKYSAQRKIESDQRTLEIVKPYLDARTALYQEAIESASKLSAFDDPGSAEAIKERSHFHELRWSRMSFVDDKDVSNAMRAFDYLFEQWNFSRNHVDRDKLRHAAMTLAYDCRDSLEGTYVQSLGLGPDKWDGLFSQFFDRQRKSVQDK